MLTRRTRVLTSLLGAGSVAIGAAQTGVYTPAPRSPIPVGRGPGNILIADVNGDKRQDLLVASAGIRQIAVLLGQGDGRFAPRAEGPIEVPDPPTEVAVGDVNGDRHIDIAVGSHDSFRVVVLLGNGRGAFSASPSSAMARDGVKPHTHGVEIADFNNDGRADLATVNSDDLNDVFVSFGDGKGTFTRAPGSPHPVGAAPYPMAVADVNGDGNSDIVVSSTGLSAPSVGLTALFGDGRGAFRRVTVPTRKDRTWFVAIADVNGDRRPDILATHTEDRWLTVLLGDGRGGFSEASGSPFELGAKSFGVRPADVDRDGHLDVLVAAETGMRVLRGDGRGGFAPAPGSPFATGRGTWKVAVADFNGDGKVDAATTNLESNSVSVFLGR